MRIIIGRLMAGSVATAIILPAVIVILAGSAGTASASVYLAEYTGTVIGGYDGSGVFGAPNTSLNGDAFVAIFTYDTAVGGRSTDPGVNDQVYGGAVFSLPSPVSATLEISGVTQSIAGYFSGVATAQPGLVFDAVEDYPGNVTNGYVDNYLSTYAQAPSATASLDNTFPSESATNSPGTGGFNFLTFDSDTSTYSVYAYGGFATSTVQISAITPCAECSNVTPLPAALPLFATGIGLMGLLGWRKKRKAAAQVAA